MRAAERPDQPRPQAVLSLHQIAVDGQLVASELAPPEKPSVGMTVLQTRRSRMSQRWRSRTLSTGSMMRPLDLTHAIIVFFCSSFFRH